MQPPLELLAVNHGRLGRHYEGEQVETTVPGLEPPWSGIRSRLALLTLAEAAALVMIIALGVRAIGLSARPLWLDEAYSAWFSSRSWDYLWTVVPTYEPHPPFYYSVLKL